MADACNSWTQNICTQSWAKGNSTENIIIKERCQVFWSNQIELTWCWTVIPGSDGMLTGWEQMKCANLQSNIQHRKGDRCLPAMMEKLLGALAREWCHQKPESTQPLTRNKLKEPQRNSTLSRLPGRHVSGHAPFSNALWDTFFSPETVSLNILLKMCLFVLFGLRKTSFNI